MYLIVSGFLAMLYEGVIILGSLFLEGDGFWTTSTGTTLHYFFGSSFEIFDNT